MSGYLCLAALFTVALATVLCLPVRAQSYLDDCAELSADGVVSYHGFTVIPDYGEYSGWQSCADATALSAETGGAAAVYRISGGERVSAAIYAMNGTLAFPAPEGGFRLGMSARDSPAQARRTLYDSARDIVFVRSGQEDFALVCSMEGFVLRPSAEVCHSDGQYYGVSFEVSRDGKRYLPLDCGRLMRVESQWLSEMSGSSYYEVYETALPRGVSYIRVSLRGYRMVRGVDGMPDQPALENMLALAGITVEGDSLILGEPPVSSSEPPVSSSEPPVSSSEPPVSSSEPPVSSSEPPVSSSEPPASSSEPPASSSEPPVSSSEPPVSSSEPPASSSEPPVSSSEPPVSSSESLASSRRHRRRTRLSEREPADAEPFPAADIPDSMFMDSASRLERGYSRGGTSVTGHLRAGDGSAPRVHYGLYGGAGAKSAAAPPSAAMRGLTGCGMAALLGVWRLRR